MVRGAQYTGKIMETHPKDSLNDLLQQWREEMGKDPAFRPSDLDELEVHLRDAIESWKAKGLNDEEAFTIANQRMGHRNRLAIEFNKANPERRLLNPAAWMLAGGLLFSVLSSLFAMINQITLLISSSAMAALGASKMSTPVIALCMTLISILMIGLAFHFVRRGLPQGVELISRLLRRPAALFLSVIVLFLVHRGAMVLGEIMLVRTLSLSDLESIRLGAFFPRMIGSYLLPLVISYALYWRASSGNEERCNS